VSDTKPENVLHPPSVRETPSNAASASRRLINPAAKSRPRSVAPAALPCTIVTERAEPFPADSPNLERYAFMAALCLEQGLKRAGSPSTGFYPFAIKDLLRNLPVAPVPVQHCQH